MSQPRRLVPIYQLKEIAAQVNMLLNPFPRVTWKQVDAYVQPQLPGMDERKFQKHDATMQRLIKSAIDRELRYRHVWRP